MIKTTHHQGEYTGTDHDIRERHENPDNSPINYPNFSDKKWRSIYHVHRKAMRLLEKEKNIQYHDQLIRLRGRVLELLINVRDIKSERRKKYEGQKQRLKVIGNLRSGNKPNSITQILQTDYSDLEDGFLVWLWNATSYARIHNPSKKIRKSTGEILDLLVVIMKQRGLPTAGEELKKYLNNIPPEEMREYTKSANGHVL